jgi:hypothetical protein
MRRARAPKTAVVLYDPKFAAKQKTQVKKSGGRRPGPAIHYRPTGLQSAAFIGRSQFRPCGAADVNSEISNDGSLKIRGHGLLGRSGSLNVPTGRIVAPNLTTGYGMIQTNVTSVSVASFLGPATLDPRLAAIGSVYSYYTIRKLSLHYVPSVSQYNYQVGTAPNASGTTALMTLGLTDQTDYVNSTPPATPQQIADLPSSVTGPAYQPLTMEYSTKGSRVYYTSTLGNGSDINETFQLSLCGLWHSLTPVGSSDTTMGSLHAEWEVDFYRPMYPQTSVTEGKTLQRPELQRADFKTPPAACPSNSRKVDEPSSPTQSLLGAELSFHHVTRPSAASRPVAIPGAKKQT